MKTEKTTTESQNSTNAMLAVRAGLLKQIFQYETKSKIQMEW